MVKNANEILFRASSNGHLMVDGNSISELQLKEIEDLLSRDKITAIQNKKLDALIYKRDNPELSEGVKTHLVNIFVSERYGRKEYATSKFLDKGNEREEDAVTLLSRVTKKFYKKNTIKLSNEFVKGEPDLSDSNDILKAKETTDTKCCWSAHTFFRTQKEKVNPIYKWQGVTYMWLTGATKHNIAYCLVNGTAKAILDEKKKVSWNYGIDADIYPEYVEQCKQIEINHIFDIEEFKKENPHFDFHNDLSEWSFDIPKEERVYIISFDRCENEINKLRKRIIDCRKYMNKNLFKANEN